LREFLPYFREQAMDVAIVDAVWNGVWQSMKIAAAADAHEVNIAPHNFYGQLATMMNAHLAAATPNLRIMEVDIDRLPSDEELFTKAPRFEQGSLSCPTSLGGAQSPTKREFAPMSPGPGAACSIIASGRRDSGAGLRRHFASTGGATQLGRERRGFARGRDRPFGLFRQAHQSAQRVASARQAGADGADRNTEDVCGGLVRHSFEPDEQDHLALLPRQAGERQIEFVPSDP
jgi:hypothetical protein